MARPHNSEDSRGSHVLPKNVRSNIHASALGQARKEVRTPLRNLASQARSRKAKRSSQTSRNFTSSSESNSGDYARSSSSATSSRRSGSHSPALYSHRVGNPTNINDFRSKDSISAARSYDSTPESVQTETSIDRLNDDAQINDSLSRGIEELGQETHITVAAAIFSACIGDAMFACYTGAGISKLEELNKVAEAANRYGLEATATRAKLWKAMILNTVDRKSEDENSEIGELLVEILTTMHDKPESYTEADHYHLKRMILQHVWYLFLHFDTLRRSYAPTDYTPPDPKSSATRKELDAWLGNVLGTLDEYIGERWPSRDELMEAITANLPDVFSLQNVAPKNAQGIREVMAQVKALGARNEQLEADIARYRAERAMYSGLNTPVWPPASYSQQALSRASGQSSLRSQPGQGRASNDNSELFYRSASGSAEIRDGYYRSFASGRDVPSRMSDDLIGLDYARGPQGYRKGSMKQYSRSPSRRRPLVVRNGIPSSASGSSSRKPLYRRSQSRSSKSRFSFDWRTGAPAAPSEQQRDVMCPEPYTDQEHTSERRGSNLRNVAPAESSNDDLDDEVSPTSLLHRKPFHVRQRPHVATQGHVLDKPVDRIKRKPVGGIITTPDQYNDQESGHARELEKPERLIDAPDTSQARRRSSADFVLQMDEEGLGMTEALSPVELEKTFSQFLEYKKHKQRKSASPSTSPSTSDYPPYEELTQRLRNGEQLKRKMKPVENGTNNQFLALTPRQQGQIPDKTVPVKANNLAPAPDDVLETSKGKSGADFGFNIVQQHAPQLPGKKLSRPRSKDNLHKWSDRKVAPLTPATKSPPSSAISVTNNLWFDQGIFSESPPSTAELDRYFPRDHPFEASASPTAKSDRDLGDFKPGPSPVNPHHNTFKLPEWSQPPQLNITNEQKSNQSSEGSETTTDSNVSSKKDRISWGLGTFLKEIKTEINAYVSPARRGSAPTVSSPLRSSFGPEELSSSGGAFLPGDLSGIPRGDSDVSSAAGEFGRQNSIYDEIENDYPSPVSPRSIHDRGVNANLAEQRAVEEHVEEDDDDTGYESDDESPVAQPGLVGEEEEEEEDTRRLSQLSSF